MQKATTHTEFPAKVLALASKPLREHVDERKVWELAGNGWKAVLVAHRDTVIQKFVSPLNTPRAEQVDKLFEAIVGGPMSPHWHWHGMASKRAVETLDKLVTIRGEIAHRVAASKPVRKRVL